jgi:diaminopimelate epimerase
VTDRGVAYFKVSGAGNDFLALAEPDATPAEEEIRAWCRRGVSLGADGFFVLRRRKDGRVGMDYWNADGRPADLCLNGTRCAVRLAFDLGWAEGAVAVETPAGGFTGRLVAGDRVAIEGAPAPDEPRALAVAIEGVEHRGWAVMVGVPHFVLVWPEELGRAPVATLGAALRRHPVFAPAGTNVHFVRFPESGARRRMEIRTYERGVEAETLACGTGVLAGAAVGLLRGKAAVPLTALTAGGFELEVDAAPRHRPFAPGARWTLTGDARVLARGVLTPQAGRQPAPPAWSAA